MRTEIWRYLLWWAHDSRDTKIWRYLLWWVEEHTKWTSLVIGAPIVAVFMPIGLAISIINRDAELFYTAVGGLTCAAIAFGYPLIWYRRTKPWREPS
jgi:amino acid permease